MNVLIVSPSAILRGTFKDLLSEVPGLKGSVSETGSALQVSRILAERNPTLVIWDDAVGDGTSDMVEQTRRDPCRYLVIVSLGAVQRPAGTEDRIIPLAKMDFSNFSYGPFRDKVLPVLTDLAGRMGTCSDGPGRAGPGIPDGAVALVVLGASTGGPAAVRTVLATLPGDFPSGIALVQHIDTGYDAGYAQWLQDNTRLKVRLAVEGDRVGPGEVLVAPTDRHLVSDGNRFSLDPGPKVHSQRPAVDRLFTTAAEVYGSSLVGVLLTGIGYDGGMGCRDIVTRGGFTLVQDEATSTVYGMPKAAAELNGASRILPLDLIGPSLLELVLARKNL